MKRYLLSFGAPLLALYVICAFTNWTLWVHPGEWEPVSRLLALIVYLWTAGSLYAMWPGSSAP